MEREARAGLSGRALATFSLRQRVHSVIFFFRVSRQAHQDAHAWDLITGSVYTQARLLTSLPPFFLFTDSVQLHAYQARASKCCKARARSVQSKHVLTRMFSLSTCLTLVCVKSVTLRTSPPSLAAQPRSTQPMNLDESSGGLERRWVHYRTNQNRTQTQRRVDCS